MLPTFIIGLREGLEAALIVGIVAAFLGQQGRRDALRQVWIGVAAAVALCLAIGFGLQALSRDLPQRQQEMLETVIGTVAVGFVTYMILWMRRHARDLKGDLEGHAASALASGSARALVMMAFLGVLREGFETAVFLLATFQNSNDPAVSGLGAVLGVLIAVIVGFLIYKGGLKINMARFFRVTGVVLVVIAAGLVMSAFHTGHEAGWVTFGQGSTWNLDWLVNKGTPVESLVTGVLGIQQKPVVIEVVGYLAYLLPMLALVILGTRRPRGGSAPAPLPESAPASASAAEPAPVPSA